MFKQWLLKAERDIDSAKLLIDGKLYDTAIYHTQQCAEKALKAFIAFKNLPIQKTHDLVVLAKICEKLDASFDDVLNVTYILNGLDVEYRYPDGLDDEINQPEESQVKDSIGYAREILDFVKKKCE